MVHISIWLNFQTWHWTKWTSLVDRLHWSIPIKAKGYLQRDQFSAVPLKKCCFFCFCLFLCIFCRSSHLIEGCEETLFCGLTHSEDRKTVHLKTQNIILHYITSPLILFLRNFLQSKFLSSVKILSTCRKLAAPSTFSTSSGKRCIPGWENKIELINCLAFLFKKQHLPSKKSALMGKSVRSRHGGGA